MRMLTGEQVGALAGISASGVVKLKHAADPLHRQAGGYDPQEVGRWLARRALVSAGHVEGDALDLAHEQAKLARQRRLNLEHEAEIAKGKYIEKASALKSFQRAGMAHRDAMLSVPGRIASTLAAMTDEREIDRVLAGEIRAELTRLADSVQGDA